jgi:HEPN domain-containing protein
MQQRDPAVWLPTAREHLVVAANVDDPVRMRCFHGQRVVEMSIKGVLVHRGIEFPYIHRLEDLVKLLPVADVPDLLAEVGALTPYAVQEMYPGVLTDLTDDHADEAAGLARVVVEWAASIIEAEPAD